jgi:hypothetical protein
MIPTFVQRRMRSFTLGAFCVFTFASTVPAQERPGTTSSYVPDLSIIMAVTQFRHFKLSYAAEVGNWELAQYEVAKVRDSLAAAATLYPVFESVEQAKLITEVSKPALIAIDKAVKERNRPAFKTSFNDLTNACNSCHKQASLGFIVIRVPTRSPFSNQVFTPAGK